MKVFVLNKRRISAVINIFLAVFVIGTLCVNSAVTTVMAGRQHDPITSVEGTENKIALTVNLKEKCNIREIISKVTDSNITFFVSEKYFSLCPEDVKYLSQNGYGIGILLENMKGKTKNKIFDIVADYIEELATITGENAQLVRFDLNEYDNNSVKAIFSLGLFPIQWSCDEFAQDFSDGNIVLISDINSVEKACADVRKSFNTVGVKNMIIYSDYEIDLSGRQKKK